jgi:hypothetical protein
MVGAQRVQIHHRPCSRCVLLNHGSCAAQRLGSQHCPIFGTAALETGSPFIDRAGPFSVLWRTFVGRNSGFLVGRPGPYGIVLRFLSHGSDPPQEYSREFTRSSLEFTQKEFTTLWRIRWYHLGVVLMAVGIVGMELFPNANTLVSLNQGGEISLGEYSLKLDKIQNIKVSNSLGQVQADLTVSKNGQAVTILHPRIDSYLKAGQAVTVPGLISSAASDLYVVLVDWQPNSDPGVTFRVFQNH